MKFIKHRYQGEWDYQRIRGFLHEVLRLNKLRELSWQAYRFDYWRWHGVENLRHGRLETDVFLWETPEGQIAGVLNREGPGSVFLQVHPGLRTPELEDEMMAVAEEHLAITGPNGRRKLRIWAINHDRLRQTILIRRGYTKGNRLEYQRRRPMSAPIPDSPVKAGYTVRSLGDVDELPSRSLASWKAFHPDEPDDRYQGWEWYHNVQRAPLYRRDLDIVAAAPDGEIAAFCTIWFDDETGTAAFEPVGTTPVHQRSGLARAVMSEGLRRLKQLGATMAYVGSWNEATHALYGSVGFKEYDMIEAWEKELA
jgi:GNAT superfamily N-acetyltransferase